MQSLSSSSLSAAERHVCAWLAAREDAFIDTLSRWVSIPTGPHITSQATLSALAVQRHELLSRLESLGASTTIVSGQPRPTWLRESASASSETVPPTPPPLAIARHWHAAPQVLLCGHIDTVHAPTASTQAGEAFDRLQIDREANKATGPGCADMKGGLLVALAALEAITHAGHTLSWGFAIVSDEETGTFCNDDALRAEAKEGYRAGLIFEPALPDGSLVIERPGSGQFMIEVHGKAAHVGRDFTKGVSAVTQLAHAITASAALADASAGKILSIGPIEGGAATNVVPDIARAWGNIRFMTDAAQAQLEEGLRVLERDGLPAVRIRNVVNRPRKPATQKVKQLATLAQQCAADLGQQLPLGTTGGVCDGNNLQAGGLPVIDTLGVRGGGLHTTSEWIELASLVERAQLTAVMLLRMHAQSATHKL
jgi:glutamate carboxypeptidase